MAYVVPGFNIVCNIWSSGSGPPPIGVAPRISNQPCGLTFGRRANVASSGGTTLAGVPIQTISLLLPKLTDVRGPQDSVGPDWVECPALTGRWYQVTFVDDVGKGYANEYRQASLFAVAGSWSAPYQ